MQFLTLSGTDRYALQAFREGDGTAAVFDISASDTAFEAVATWPSTVFA